MRLFVFFITIFLSGCSNKNFHSSKADQPINSYELGYWRISHYQDGTTEIRDVIDSKSYLKQKIRSLEGSVAKQHVFEDKPRITLRKNKVTMQWSDYIIEEWHHKDDVLNWQVTVLNNPNDALMGKKRIKNIILDSTHNLALLIVSGSYSFMKVIDEKNTSDEARFHVNSSFKPRGHISESHSFYAVDTLGYHQKHRKYPLVIETQFAFKERNLK